MLAVVALAVAAFAIVVLSLRQVAAPPSNGGVNAPPAGFDPTLAGPGLLFGPIPTLQVVQVLAVVVALAFAYRWRSIGGFDSWRDMGRGLGLIVLVAAPTALAMQPTLLVEGGYGTALGYGQPISGPPGSDVPQVSYESADPGAPMIAFFEVMNAGPLPITVNGMVSIGSPGSSGRWIALALPSDPNSYPNPVDQLRTFTRQVVAPGDSVTLYLVGKAGACAYGPGYDIESSVDATSFAAFTRNVELGYSVLGLSSTTTVEMPMQLIEPAAAHCP
jgi:hypothetical protein